MRDDDLREFTMDIRMLAAAYGEFLSDDQVKYYWTVLEDEPFDVFELVCLDLTRAEHPANAKIPSAHQLSRRMRVDQIGYSKAIPCEHAGCIELVDWPSKREDEGRMCCQWHQPDHGRPASVEERKAILATLTPAAKAFFRPVLKGLMAEMPITEAERHAAEEQTTLKRARAFEDKAEGPGVNPGVFLTNSLLAADLPSEYAERRQIVAAAGWKFDPSTGTWARGRRTLTDETIDRLPTLEVLQEFVRRR